MVPLPTIPALFTVKDLFICSAVGVGIEWAISMVNEGAKMSILKAVLVLLRAMLIPKVRLAVENRSYVQR